MSRATRQRRYLFIRRVLWIVTRALSRVLVEGAAPPAPAVLCFNHLNWIDPFYVVSSLPGRPPVYFVGPQQEDMTRGVRNRLMTWSGVAIPYKPGKRGLVAAARGIEVALASGSSVAIAGEGRIHAGESALLPLLEGPAYFAIRSGVPLVPVAINGTGWLGFRRIVRVRVGPAVVAAAGPQRHPDAAAVEALTARTSDALRELVRDFPDLAKPGRAMAWLTELFNDWDGPRPPIPPRG